MSDKSEAVPTDDDFDTRKKALADNLKTMVEAGTAEMTDALECFRLFLNPGEFGRLDLAARTEYANVVEYIAKTISNHKEWEDSGGTCGKKMDDAMVKKMEVDLDLMMKGNPEMARAMNAVLEAM